MATASCPAGTQPTVLVIDDETGPRDALKLILRTFCNVRSAENAKAALEVLSRTYRCYLVFPDVTGSTSQRYKASSSRRGGHYRHGIRKLKSAMEGAPRSRGLFAQTFQRKRLPLIQQTMDRNADSTFLATASDTGPLPAEESASVGWSSGICFAHRTRRYRFTPNDEPASTLVHIWNTDRQLLNHRAE